jgi:threonine-phosphate decarboxylase
MGAAISHPDTINRLAGFKEPWTVNGLAEKAANSLSNCNGYEMNTRQRITEQRNFIFHSLSQIPGIDLFNTPANFMLARLNDSPDLNVVMRRLLEKGIFVRDCRNFEGLEGNYVRMAVRGKDDNLRLVQAFTDVCGHYNG